MCVCVVPWLTLASCVYTKISLVGVVSSHSIGPHFLAEMIAAQDADHRMVVAEAGGRGIGLLSVTTEVDVALLGESFCLEPFHGLRAACEEDSSMSASVNSE